MPYHWPEDEIAIPRPRKRWPFRLGVILLMIFVVILVLRYPAVF